MTASESPYRWVASSEWPAVRKNCYRGDLLIGCVAYEDRPDFNGADHFDLPRRGGGTCMHGWWVGARSDDDTLASGSAGSEQEARAAVEAVAEVLGFGGMNYDGDPVWLGAMICLYSQDPRDFEPNP